MCVVDDATQCVHPFEADQPMRIVETADEFTLPDILAGSA